MKARVIFVLFLLFSTSLIFTCLYVCVEPLHLKRVEADRKAKIQKVVMKAYPRSRDVRIPERSFLEASKEIARLLKKKALFFKSGSSSLEQNNSMELNHNKVTLKGIIDVLNHMNEDVILSIATHTDKEGSQQQNLKLSQERADILKHHIRERSSVTLISAIGYGEELPLPKSTKKLINRRVEIDLKRIHP